MRSVSRTVTGSASKSQSSCPPELLSFMRPHSLEPSHWKQVQCFLVQFAGEFLLNFCLGVLPRYICFGVTPIKNIVAKQVSRVC